MTVLFSFFILLVTLGSMTFYVSLMVEQGGVDYLTLNQMTFSGQWILPRLVPVIIVLGGIVFSLRLLTSAWFVAHRSGKSDGIKQLLGQDYSQALSSIKDDTEKVLTELRE